MWRVGDVVMTAWLTETPGRGGRWWKHRICYRFKVGNDWHARHSSPCSAVGFWCRSAVLCSHPSPETRAACLPILLPQSCPLPRQMTGKRKRRRSRRSRSGRPAGTAWSSTRRWVQGQGRGLLCGLSCRVVGCVQVRHGVTHCPLQLAPTSAVSRVPCKRRSNHQMRTDT